MRLALFLCLLPAALLAQAGDSLPRSGNLPATDSALRLPADRPSDLLSWITGGGLTADETPTWHGGDAAFFDRITDGLRWATGIRSRGAMGRGAAPIRLEPEFGALAQAKVDILGGGPATLHYLTRTGADHWGVLGSAECESPVRADGGMGFSRFEAGLGGPLGGTFRVHAALTMLGREAAAGGIGYGNDPYYVPTGIDTTMRYPDGASLPDSIDAPVLTFGTTTTVPFSARTVSGWTFRVDGDVGGVSVWGRWMGSRTAERFFNYVDVTNPLQARGENSSGQDLAVGLAVPVGRMARLDAALSFQRERSETGPISSQGQYDSRDPALGLMLDGVDLRWDLDNFPVDDALLSNYRNNTPGSRRTPYDLENTAQYALIDQYRNNPYGVLGWSEAGGPQGILALYEDHRTMLTSGVTLLDPGRSFRLGVELVRHDLKYYSHSLASQAFSDVWLETPTEAALTGDWTWNGRSWTATLTARVHRFETGAVRPYLLNTDPSSSDYGEYHYYPRISSYGGGVDSLRHDVADQAHTAWSSVGEIQARIADGWTGHASGGRSARMPDLTSVLAGINTDLAITNSSAVFGTDMGHEVTDHASAGVTHRVGPFTVDATLFIDHFQHAVAARLESLYDPARNSNNDIRLLEEFDGGKYQGLTLSAGWHPTERLNVQASYAFTDTVGAAGFGLVTIPGGTPRRHAVTVMARAGLPVGGPLGGIDALVSYRRMSALAHAVGSDPFLGPFVTEGAPAWSSLDLRLTKQLPWGAKHLTLYLDGRNLFNIENLIYAFGGGGDPRRAPGLEAISWSNDSAAYAAEAERNGLYSPGGDIDLTFAGAGRGGCGGWQSASGSANPVNCAYLLAAESRFGDGDGTFSLEEQHSASMAYYRTALGTQALTGPPRAIRLGLQVAF